MFATAYEAAYRQGLDRLTRRDPEEVSVKCGCRYDGTSYYVRFFDQECTVSLPDGRITPEYLKQGQRILILHYLGSTETGHGKGEYVSYKGLPGGIFYYTPYRKRGPEWLLAAFEADPRAIFEAGRSVGGSPASFGDHAVAIPVFPKVDAIVVIHEGDDELPAELNILYRDNIMDYLSLEDIAFLGGDISGRLVKAKQQLRKSEAASLQKHT